MRVDEQPSAGASTRPAARGSGGVGGVVPTTAPTTVWASPAPPGAVHDLTAARVHDLIDALTTHGVMVLADNGYQGAGGTIRTPFRRHRHRPRLSRRQRAVNRAHARARGIDERAVATLKSWKILTKLRRCPCRATTIVQAMDENWLNLWVANEICPLTTATDLPAVVTTWRGSGTDEKWRRQSSEYGPVKTRCAHQGRATR